jgi:RNA polymerase sigma factor (sigma-70 family)
VNLVLSDYSTKQAAMSNPPEMVRLASVSVPDLSGRILAGDCGAFEEFYRRYAPRVYGLLMVLTNANDELSRELAQRVMVRVARKFRRAAEEELLWGWLAAIARNVLIDYLRAEERRHRREERASERSGFEPAGPSEELNATLEQALDELDEEDRTLVRQFYFEERAQAVIASERETTVKAVQSRLARIRRRLKESLTRKLDER